MEVDFCLEALDRAWRWGRPEIFGTSDQGCPQFTSEKCSSACWLNVASSSAWMAAGAVSDTAHLHRAAVAISLKYEEVSPARLHARAR